MICQVSDFPQDTGLELSSGRMSPINNIQNNTYAFFFILTSFFFEIEACVQTSPISYAEKSARGLPNSWLFLLLQLFLLLLFLVLLSLLFCCFV